MPLADIAKEHTVDPGASRRERLSRTASFLRAVRTDAVLRHQLRDGFSALLCSAPYAWPPDTPASSVPPRLLLDALGQTDAALFVEPEVVDVLGTHFATVFAEGLPAVGDALEPVLGRIRALPFGERVRTRWSAAAMHAARRAHALSAARRLFDVILDVQDDEHALEAIVMGSESKDSNALFIRALADTLSAAGDTALLVDVAETYCRTLRRRLLHAGVAPESVAAHIGACAAVLRAVDPTGLLLDRALAAAQPRMRKQDVRAAVLGALSAQPARNVRVRFDAEADTAALDALPADWRPDPPGEATIRPCCKTSACGSLYSLRASVLANASFERPDEAAAAYRATVLAPAILDALATHTAAPGMGAHSTPSGDTLSRVQSLVAQAEALRARLAGAGVSAGWAACTIMLADAERALASSARTHTLLVASHISWPWKEGRSHLSEDAVQTLLAIAPGLADAASAYERAHPTQSLRWRPAHARVSLRVDYASGQTATHVCSLSMARVLLRVCEHASDAARIANHASAPDSLPAAKATPVAELVAEFDAADVHAAVDMWVRAGVLVLDPLRHAVRLADSPPPSSPADAVLCAALSARSDASELLPAVTDETPDDAVLAWPYIHAMLTNLGALKAERVHAMLGMFAPDYRGDVAAVQRVLDAKVRAGLVVRGASGTYSLSAP